MDDWMWKFRADVAPSLAMPICMALAAAGCPVSWHKQSFGSKVKWIGLWHNFQMRAFTIPADKVNRALTFLLRVMGAGAKIDRSVVQSGTGLLMWLSMLLQLLRPWLAEFYTALNRPVSNLVNCSVHQLAELVDALDANMILTKSLALTTATKGWNMRDINHRPVHSLGSSGNSF